MMVPLVLAVTLAPPVAPPPPPGPVPEKIAFVQSKEALKEGKLIRASVKLLSPGTYYVVGGYVVDYDAKFQFLEGKLTKAKYYVIRKVVSERPTAIVELEFPIKALPPLVKPVAHVAIFSERAHVPILAP